MATIRIKRNDTWAKTLNVLDDQGDLVDCTGWTIYFTVRSAVPDTATSDDTTAILAKEITGNSTGVHTLELSSAETNIDAAEYLFDVQVKKSDDTIHSTETGTFVIQSDITRSV